MQRKREHPSIDSVARLAGVSKTTVSLVLNDKAEAHRIGTDTIRKVLDVAKRCAYAPNRHARGLRLKKSGTLGLIVGEIDNWFFSQLEKHLADYARSKDYSIIIASSEDDREKELSLFRDMLSHGADGIIIASSFTDDTAHRSINRQNKPVIYVDRIVTGPDVVCVGSDNKGGSFRLAEHLITTGHRRIAFVGGHKWFSTNRDRLSGFRLAFGKHRVPDVGSVVLESDFSPEFGYKCAEKLLVRETNKPDAIFTASFTLLEGFLRWVKEHGVESIKGIQLATFDDHPLLDFMPFPIHSVRQDCRTIATKAFDHFLAVSKGASVEPQTSVTPELVLR